MNKQDARLLLVETLHSTADILNNPDVSARLKDPNADLSLAELELDSFAIVEWCVELETRTDVEFDPGEMSAAATLDELAGMVSKRLGGA